MPYEPAPLARQLSAALAWLWFYFIVRFTVALGIFTARRAAIGSGIVGDVEDDVVVAVVLMRGFLGLPESVYPVRKHEG